MGRYSTKRKSNRWNHTTFAYILDTARCNAQTICALQKKWIPRNTKSFEFGIYLAKSLVTPAIESRSLNGLQARICMKMSFMLDRQVGRFGGSGRGRASGAVGAVQGAVAAAAQMMRRFAQKGEKQKRCKICEDLAQTNAEKDRVTKIMTRCGCCGIPACANHFYIICVQCSEKFAPIRDE